MNSYVFCDIDGTLNGEIRHPNGYCGMDPACVYRLNRIVAETGAKVVISSAWRYMIVPDSMTLLGFKNLMMTYGLDKSVEIVGRTESDEETRARSPHFFSRDVQIWRWLYLDRLRQKEATGFFNWCSYVVLDNGSDVPSDPPNRTLSESLRLAFGERWVKTDTRLGLTDEDADRAIEILKTPIRP